MNLRAHHDKQVSWSVKHLVSSAYIKPWKDKTRAGLMLAALPAYFGAGMQGVMLSYTIAGEGAVATTLFHLMRSFAMGLVFIPLTYWLLSKKQGKYFVLLLQAIGTMLFMYDPKAALLNGLGNAMTGGPFWAVFGERNSCALSEDNHGNEVALLNYMQGVFIALGIFCGGLFLKLELYTFALLLSGPCLILSTGYYARKIDVAGVLKKARSLLGWKRPANRLSFFAAAIFAFFDNGLPSWMRLIGLSPLSTGTVLAMRPLLGLILTPIAGNLIKKGGLAAGVVGGIFLSFGWIILGMAPMQTLLLLPALGLQTVGTGLIAPTEVNRWFKRRSISAIMAREWVLFLGRVATNIVILPAVFFWPPSFPILGLFASGLFAFGSRRKRR